MTDEEFEHLQAALGGYGQAAAAISGDLEDGINADRLLSTAERDGLLAALAAAEADRDRARDAAVALEQENAQLTERIAAASKRARTRDEDLLHMRDNSKNAQRTMSRGHAWEVAAYEVRTIADLLNGGEAL